MTKDPIVVLQDDREKKRTWDQKFLGEEFLVKTTRLTTGDYTLEEFQDLVCIERKASWDEIASNISTKAGRQRLQFEFQRMEAYPLRFLIVESSLTQIPFTRFYSQYMNPVDVRNWVHIAMLEHGIQTFCIGKTSHSKVFMREFLTAIYDRLKCMKLSRQMKDQILQRRKAGGQD